MNSNTSDQRVLDARDFSEARAHSDPNGRVRLVHITGIDSPDRLPVDAPSWFKSSRDQRTWQLVISICGVIAALGTLIVLLVLLEHWWIAVVIVSIELLLMFTLLSAISKSNARTARGTEKLNLSELSFLDTQPQQGTVVRVWPKFYEGDFVDLAIAVEVNLQRPANNPVLVTAGETAGPRSEVVKLLAEQLPREGDTAWVWRAGSGIAATAIQVAIRRPGQASPVADPAKA